MLEKVVANVDMNNSWEKKIISKLINDEIFFKEPTHQNILLKLFRANNLISEEFYLVKLNSNLTNKEFRINESTKNELKNLIGKDELDTAMNKMLELTKNNPRLSNEIIHHKGSYNNLNQGIRLGIYAQEEVNIKKNSIRRSLLAVISLL